MFCNQSDADLIQMLLLHKSYISKIVKSSSLEDEADGDILESATQEKHETSCLLLTSKFKSKVYSQCLTGHWIGSESLQFKGNKSTVIHPGGILKEPHVGLHRSVHYDEQPKMDVRWSTAMLGNYVGLYLVCKVK